MRIAPGSETHLHVHKRVCCQSDEPACVCANAPTGLTSSLFYCEKSDVLERLRTSCCLFNAWSEHASSHSSPTHLCLDFFGNLRDTSEFDKFVCFACVLVMSWSLAESCTTALCFTSEDDNQKGTMCLHLQFLLVKCRVCRILETAAVIERCAGVSNSTHIPTCTTLTSYSMVRIFSFFVRYSKKSVQIEQQV